MSCCNIVFRRPVPDDLPRLAAALAGWWDGPGPSPRLTVGSIAGRCATSILAEYEERLLGFVLGPPSGDGDRAEAAVAVVDPAWRAAGLAADLLRRAEAFRRPVPATDAPGASVPAAAGAGAAVAGART